MIKLPMFKNKTILITGGTGSFGETILNYFLSKKIKEIRIFSRDEKKQDDLRKKYNNSKLKFYIGDVRDYQSVLNCVRGSDYIFHAAALKQVPSCEFYPMEAVKTNILGTENVLDAAIKCSVKRVIVLSTDKAVYPINAIGISKAMMEKVAIQKSHTTKKTIINITRYGNVMGSRGSVIPLFIKQILNNLPITITDPEMTRFNINMNEAIDLTIYSLINLKGGEIFVPKIPSFRIIDLAKAISNESKIKVIGIRPGEKVHEEMISAHEN